MIKPSRKEIISSSSEETDDDDIPLRQRSVLARKRTQVETQNVTKGIVINERQEQPPAKRSKNQPPSTQTKGKEITPVETPAEPVSPAPVLEQTIETTTFDIPQEPQIETSPQEFMVSAIPSTANEEHLVADQAAIVNVEKGPSLAESVEKETTANTNTNSAAELEKEADKETSVEMREEEPKETPVPEDTADMVMVDRNEEEREDAENESATQEDSSFKDSTTSAISDQELSKLKTENPLAAFKLLLSLSSSSPKMAGSSSTTSLNSINQETTEGLLRQLKTKVLEGDLLARIEQNQVECFEIKSITQKLQQAEPNQELLAFLIEFGPLFEQLSSNISKRATTQKHKEQVNKLYQEESQALKTAQDNISAMEAQAEKDEKEIAEWDAKIQRYKEEIAIIQAKLNNAEYQKGLVKERMETSTSSKLKDEAVVAIKHFENVSEHQATISQLDKNLGQLETSITLSASILDRLKASLAKL